MDLLALALVNVVTAGAMYVFFSLRFTRAVEQARKNSVVKDLKENVELTIEFINASLDLMDQKNRSFYQMLRRAEDLTKQWDEVLESGAAPAKPRGSKKKSAKKAAKKTAVKSKAPPPTVRAESITDAELPERGIPHDIPDDDFDEEAVAGRGGYNVEGVLAGLGEDQLDISPSPASSVDAYRSGEASRPRSAVPGDRYDWSRTAADGPAPGEDGALLGRLGGFVRRMFGLPQMDTGARPAPAAEPRTRRLPAERPPARFTIPELPPEVEEPPAPRLPRLDRLELEPVRPESPEERLTYGPGETASPAFSGQPESWLNPGELSDRLQKQGAKKSDVARTLLNYGYRVEEIQAATGLSRPEIELVASLPAGGPRPRKHRLAGNERVSGD